MELRIRNLDDTTHEAIKVAAARSKQSLNQFAIEALRAAALRAAKRDRAVAAVLQEGMK